MNVTKLYRFVTFLLLICLFSCVQADQDWPWDNPFGFCNPWPAAGQIGAVWCRCGGGSTHMGNWPDIQPDSADRFDWSRADAEYKNQHKPENLIPVPILCYTPKWAMSGPEHDLSYPQNLFDYFRFVNAVAARYRGKVPAYEVWNEPDGRGGFFRGGCNDLARMIKLAYCAIKQADPNIQVIFPGLAGGNVPYAQRLYELGVRDYFDIMAFHPYQWSDTFSEGWSGGDSVRGIREVMDRYEDNVKPIWLNEFGWSKEADTNARLLAVSMTFYHSLESLGVQKMIWYTIKSWGDSYGLFDNDGRKTVAVDAYKTVVTHLLGKHFIGQIPVEKARAFVFAASDFNQPVTIAVWSPTLESIDIQIPLNVSDPIKITQLYGDITQVTPDQGRLAMQATPAPQYFTVPRNAILQMEKGPEIPPRPGMKDDPTLARNLWAQVVVPENTHRAFIVPGDTELTLEIFNCSNRPQGGILSISSPPLQVNISKKYEVAPFRSTVVKFRLRIARDAEFKTYPLTISGTAGKKKMVEYTDQIRVCRGRAIEFLGNSWIESKYMKEPAAGAPSISFGNRWSYEFDLSGCKEAVLSTLLGSHGKEWTLAISKDGVNYETLISADTWPFWRQIQIPAAYLEHKIILKIEGNDCMLKELLLDYTL